MSERSMGASVVIKNVSGGEYTILELGGIIIANNATIDLMDDGLAIFYDNWTIASELVTKPNPSQLWTDIQAGDIEVVSSTPLIPSQGGNPHDC
jgi:hypothetical protein